MLKDIVTDHQIKTMRGIGECTQILMIAHPNRNNLCILKEVTHLKIPDVMATHPGYKSRGCFRQVDVLIAKAGQAFTHVLQHTGDGPVSRQAAPSQ